MALVMKALSSKLMDSWQDSDTVDCPSISSFLGGLVLDSCGVELSIK